jgi:hypothetical protein
MVNRYTHHCAECDVEITHLGYSACLNHPGAAVYMRQSEPPTRFEERVAAVNEAGGLDVTVLASAAPEAKPLNATNQCSCMELPCSCAATTLIERLRAENARVLANDEGYLGEVIRALNVERAKADALRTDNARLRDALKRAIGNLSGSLGRDAYNALEELRTALEGKGT